MNISNIAKALDEIIENATIIKNASDTYPKAALLMKMTPMMMAMVKEGLMDGKDIVDHIHSLIYKDSPPATSNGEEPKPETKSP